MKENMTAVERTKILGMPLFLEAEEELQNRNRVKIAVNVLEDNLNKQGTVTQHGLYLFSVYWEAIKELGGANLSNEVEAELYERKLLVGDTG